MPKKPSKPVRATPRRHPDSVVDEDDIIDVTPEPVKSSALTRSAPRSRGEPSRLPVRAETPRLPTLAEAQNTAAAAAQQLILDAKDLVARTYSRRSYAVAGSIRLDLENELEVQGAMWLEHQGKGHLYKVSGGWVFEFNEDAAGLTGGVLSGDILEAKEHEKDWGA